jgi:L,D-peptidoglycan transpeptidase YkuD (ErfK/YbiS/YcfS/YnhG family)
LTAPGLTIAVALGRGGILANKREGDGGTPRGIFHPRQIWWRADRHRRPRSFLAARAITPTDAWCEDPNDRHYNQPIRVTHDDKRDPISWSRSITTRDRASPAAAARYSCISRPTISVRPRAVFP